MKDAEAYIARLNGVAEAVRSVDREPEGARGKGSRAAEVCFSARARRLPERDRREAVRRRRTKTARCWRISPRKSTRLKEVDQPTRDRLLADADKALTESFKPAYQKLIAFLEAQEKTAPPKTRALEIPGWRGFLRVRVAADDDDKHDRGRNSRNSA